MAVALYLGAGPLHDMAEVLVRNGAKGRATAVAGLASQELAAQLAGFGADGRQQLLDGD